MSDNKVVRWGSSMFIDPIGSYVTYHDYMMLKEENDRLRAELAEAKAQRVPDDVARDAERYRWMRDKAREELFGDELLTMFDRRGPAFDMAVDNWLAASQKE